MTVTAFTATTSVQLGLAPPLTGALSSYNALLASSCDMADGGRFRLAGQTRYIGPPQFPVSRLVRLYDHLSGRLVRAQWSTPLGAYAFDNIRQGMFYVTSDDYTGAYNGVIATKIMSEPMP